MVKKIDSLTTTPTAKVDHTSSIDAVGRTSAVKAIQKALSVTATDRTSSTLKISPQNHAEIIRCLNEEADHYFKSQRIPKRMQKIIKEAIVMALNASQLEEEEDQ